MQTDLNTVRARLIRQLTDAAAQDTRVVSLIDYGSSSETRADRWSDVDLALFIRDADLDAFERDWQRWAAQWGTLLLAYVGGIGHPWTVYDAQPIPLRVDFAFHRASEYTKMLSWPNAPSSASAMVLYDGSDGTFIRTAQQLVGRSLGPPDAQQAFNSVCGDLWYYFLRTWTRLLRDQQWAARYDFHHILLGNLIALLRFEAGALERWQGSSAAVDIERVISAQRLAQLDACIPAPGLAGLRRAFARTAQLGYDVSAAVADVHGWSWPQQLAARIRDIVAVEQQSP